MSEKVVHEYDIYRVIALSKYFQLQCKRKKGWADVEHHDGYSCMCSCMDGALEDATYELARLAERNKMLEAVVEKLKGTDARPHNKSGKYEIDPYDWGKIQELIVSLEEK